MFVNVLLIAVRPIVVMLFEVSVERVGMIGRRAMLVSAGAVRVRVDLGPGNARRNDRHRQQSCKQAMSAKTAATHAVSVPQDELLA